MHKSSFKLKHKRTFNNAKRYVLKFKKKHRLQRQMGGCQKGESDKECKLCVQEKLLRSVPSLNKNTDNFGNTKYKYLKIHTYIDVVLLAIQNTVLKNYEEHSTLAC